MVIALADKLTFRSSWMRTRRDHARLLNLMEGRRRVSASSRASQPLLDGLDGRRKAHRRDTRALSVPPRPEMVGSVQEASRRRTV